MQLFLSSDATRSAILLNYCNKILLLTKNSVKVRNVIQVTYRIIYHYCHVTQEGK
jgi:hypothetical protein